MIFKTNITKYLLVFLTTFIYIVESYTIIQIDDENPVLVKNEHDHIKILKEVTRSISKYKKFKNYLHDFIGNLKEQNQTTRNSMEPYNIHFKNKRKLKLIKHSMEPHNNHLKNNRHQKSKSRQTRDVKSKNLMFISTNVKHGGPSKIRRDLTEHLTYIPLFRIHKHDNDKYNERDQDIVKIVYPKIKKLDDGKYAKIQSKENESILHSLWKLSKAYRNRLKPQIYLVKYDDLIKKLRAGKFLDQSGEIYDPLAPGHTVLDYGHEHDLSISQQTPLYLHEYTPWDWWTVSKKNKLLRESRVNDGIGYEESST